MASFTAVGTGFIQVVPSFSGFHRKARRDLDRMVITGSVQLTPDIDAGAARKQADATAKAMGRDVNMTPDMDVSEGERRADRAARKMARTVHMPVELDDLGGEKALLNLHKRLMARPVTIPVHVNTARAMAELAVFNTLAGRVGRNLTMLTGRATAAFGAVALLSTASSGIGGLASALGTAAGAALILPGAMAAGAAVVGTLALGMQGVGDTMSAIADGDAKKFEEQLGKLAPPARDLFRAVWDLRGQFTELRTSVQGALFQGLAGPFRDMATETLPVLRAGLTGIADALNGVIRQVMQFYSQAHVAADLGNLFASTATLVRNWGAAFVPILSILEDIGTVGAQVLASLSTGAVATTQRWAEFINTARESGQLETWIRNGLAALRDLFGTLSNVGQIFYTVFSTASQAGGGLFGVLRQVTGELLAMLRSAEGQSALTTFFGTLKATADAAMPGLRAIAGALLSVIRDVGPSLPSVGAAFAALATALAPVLEGFGWLVGTIVPPLAAFLGWAAPAFGVLASALAVAGPVVWVLVNAWKVWNAVLVVWEVLLTANPIGLVVVALAALVGAVIYAWHNFDWFRAAVLATWDFLVQVGQWIGSVFVSIWSGLSSAVQAVGGWFVWLWQSAIVPAWNGIVAAVSWAWSTVLSPVLSFIGLALRILGAMIFTVLVAPWVIAWNVLTAAANWAWTTVLQPLFGLIGGAAASLYNDYIGPFFRMIGDAWAAMVTTISNWWNQNLRPLWDQVAGFARWLWQGALSIVFGLIQGGWSLLVGVIRAYTNDVLLPIWRVVQTVAGALGDFLGWVFSGISAAWRGMSDFLRSVYDTGIRPLFDLAKSAVESVGQAFEWVSNWIRDTWARIRDYARDPINFVVDVVYNRGLVPVWNGIAGVFGLGKLNPMPLMASGGMLPAAPMATNQPTAIVGEGSRTHPEYVIPTDPKYRRRASSLWAAAGANMGMPFMASGGILGDAWGALKGAAGAVVGGISDAFGWVMSIAGDIGGGVKKLFSAILGSGERTPGSGTWTDALKRLPVKVVDAAIQKIKDWFGSMGGGGAYGAFPVAAAGAGVQRWAPLVLQALAMLGQPAAYLGITLRRMNQESGGNPNIGNFWDSNAVKGTPSMGLMQVIGPTFAAYRDPRAPNNLLDPLANILASMRYALARYGSLPAAYNRAGGYDSGGWLPPGYSLTYNGTGRPEAILTADQWDTMRGAAEGRGSSITVNYAESDVDPQKVAAAIDRRLAMTGRL